MKKLTAASFVVLLALSFGNAQTIWKVDKAHSQVNFSVTHMVFSEVTGTFKEFDAKLTASKDDFTDAKVEATIKTASIDTQNEKRDGHVRSNDFLNVEQFPEITFTSTKFEQVGKENYKIFGDLTIRATTKPVVLDAKYKGTIKDSRGNTRIAFKATTSIDRFEFGTTWDASLESGGLIAGKEIEITLLFQFVKQK